MQLSPCLLEYLPLKSSVLMLYKDGGSHVVRKPNLTNVEKPHREALRLHEEGEREMPS